MAADPAHADDQQGLAAQLVLALGEIANHAAPYLLVLIVARLRQAPCDRQDERDRMLGHGAGVDAGRTRQTDVLRAELLLGILVHARGDGLDELEPAGMR